MNLSKHFKISLGIIALAAIVLFVGYRYVSQRIMRGGTTGTSPARPPFVLPKNDKETVSFNEKTHVLTVVTATKTIKEYAKSPEVEIRKDGSAVVSRHLTGFENEPFIGFGYSDTGRVFLGDNICHVARLDLLLSVSWTPVNRVIAFKPYAGIGYNFYHNTSVNLAVNPTMIITKVPDVAGFVSVRF